MTQLTASEGYIHKIGTDTYAKSVIMLPGETADMYEEVAEIPPYTKAEYDAKVNELVRQRYSESEEFAIQRKMLNTLTSPMTMSEEGAESAVNEYAEYNAYVEQCKTDAPDAILADIEARKAQEEAEAERQRLEAEEAERARLEEEERTSAEETVAEEDE